MLQVYRGGFASYFIKGRLIVEKELYGNFLRPSFCLKSQEDQELGQCSVLKKAGPVGVGIRLCGEWRGWIFGVLGRG
jgi:hypothetical protein